MSLDEMNTLFKPPAPATTIVPTNGDTGGACNYEVAKANIPLIIYFLEWKGPDPIPQSDIDAELAQAIGTETHDHCRDTCHRHRTPGRVR